MDATPVVLGDTPDIPIDIMARVVDAGIDPTSLLIAAETDLNEAGQITSIWMVVTSDQILSIPTDPSVPIDAPIRFEQVDDFRLRSTVGSTSIQAMYDFLPVIVVRFTNRYRERFQRVLFQLKRLKEGQPLQTDRLLAPDPRFCSQCGLMLPTPTTPCPKCLKHGAILQRMLPLFRDYLQIALMLMVLMGVGIGLDLLPPFLTRILVDDVLTTGNHADWLLWLVVGLAGASLLRGVVNIIVSRLSTRVGTRITYDMRQRLFLKLEQMSIDYYDRMDVGNLMNRCLSDVEQLQGFVNQITQGFLINILTIIAIGVSLFSLDAVLALYVLIPIPFVTGGTIYFYRRIYPKYYKVSDSRSKLTSTLNGILGGMRLVKAFAQEQRENRRFTESNESLRSATNTVSITSGTFSPIMAFVFGLGGLIIWYVGGYDVLEDRITLGTLMAFLGLVSMFYSPLSGLTQMSNWLTSFMASSQRIFEILDADPRLHDPPDAAKLDTVEGRIEFDGVTFGYDPFHPVIQNVSFKIEPGQMVGIVGRSGSGKSTLINLICRFYDVQEGAVRLDGLDVRDIKRSDIRRHIGLVLQEPFLFRASIAENIAYGRPDAPIEDIIRSAKAANAHDFIMNHPAGYDTKLGEQGAGLSGGERQRLSIARALLCDPDILILDEATSSVDTESEQQIQEALARLCKGRTTIAVAHRLSTLRGADCIYVIDNGRLAEYGSHHQLMDQEGIYHRLVRIQTQLTSLETA
jgi:ATP-binding cassette subfamily B protein